MLGPAERRQLDELGYLALPGFIAPATLFELRERVEAPWGQEGDEAGAVADERGYWVCNSVWMLDDFTPDNGATRMSGFLKERRGRVEPRDRASLSDFQRMLSAMHAPPESAIELDWQASRPSKYRG